MGLICFLLWLISWFRGLIGWRGMFCSPPVFKAMESGASEHRGGAQSYLLSSLVEKCFIPWGMVLGSRSPGGTSAFLLANWQILWKQRITRKKKLLCKSPALSKVNCSAEVCWGSHILGGTIPWPHALPSPFCLRPPPQQRICMILAQVSGVHPLRHWCYFRFLCWVVSHGHLMQNPPCHFRLKEMVLPS